MPRILVDCNGAQAIRYVSFTRVTHIDLRALNHLTLNNLAAGHRSTHSHLDTQHW